MLIQFTVENWMSFRDKATFSTVATSECQHNDRVCKLKNFQTGVIPVSVIFGGNASGKTNLFRALRFAQSLIVYGTEIDSSIPVEPFVLNKDGTNSPTTFAFELWINNLNFKYNFSVTSKEVLKENLILVNSSKERILYSRQCAQISFDETLNSDLLQFIFESTWDNQLFLTNIGSHKLSSQIPENLMYVHNWFKDTLHLISPNIHFKAWSLLNENQLFNEMFNKILSKLDTGISRLDIEDIPFDNISNSNETKSDIRDKILNNPERSVNIRLSNYDQLYREENIEYLVITSKQGEPFAKMMKTYHTNTDQFELNVGFPRESHGSQRVIELLPAFIDLTSQILSPEVESIVYVIDEIDRSLHSHMTVQLIRMYLDTCSHDSKNQLIFTTHDNSLINQKLFRRDEIWFTERHHTGTTTLISLSDYKGISYDKDIRKSYMDGRLGGVPRIESAGIFNALLDTD